MKTSCLVEAIDAARESLDYAIDLVPEGRSEWKATPDSWSLKDIIAHVAWHDDQMVEVAETRILAGSLWWTLSTDIRNHRIFEKYRDTEFEEIAQFAAGAYSKMRTAVAALPDDDLNDAAQFADMPKDWIPWRLFASNTYEHYLRHIGQIRRLANGAS